jgi:hypothetical protein
MFPSPPSFYPRGLGLLPALGTRTRSRSLYRSPFSVSELVPLVGYNNIQGFYDMVLTFVGASCVGDGKVVTSNLF